MMAEKPSNDEPRPDARNPDESKTKEPMSIFDRRILGFVAALVPTLFLVLGAWIWGINGDVIRLESRVIAVEGGTQGRYTAADAKQDNDRIHERAQEIHQRIYALSAEVNRLKGLHEIHKKGGEVK